MGTVSSFRLLATSLLAVLLTLPGCPSGDGAATPGSGPEVFAPTDTRTVRDTGPLDAEVGGGEVAPPGAVWLSAATAATAEADRVPRNVHQTWQHDPATTVTIQWTTEARGAEGYEPRVWFARADELREEGGEVLLPFDGAHAAKGLAIDYQTQLTGDAVFLQCEVELTGLRPRTDYVFRAGSWEDVDAAAGALVGATLSPLHRLRTAPTSGDPAPFRFLAAGDSRGAYEDIARHAARLDALDTDFVLFSGDMTDLGTWEEWSEWFGAMGPLGTDRVIMPVLGNHELFSGLFYGQHALPLEEGLAEDLREHAWSVVYGNTLVLGLDSLTRAAADAQVGWLEARLRDAAEDPDLTWRIVVYHHSAYSSSNHGSAEHVRDTWVPLFERYGVDLAIAGHDHNYERSVPIEGQAEAPPGEGVVHVVAGGFFAPGYSPGSNWWTVVSHHGDKHNYTVVEVDGPTLHLTAYSGDGSEVLDEFTLTK